MAQSILIFDFGTNEEAAQQARHKVDGWKQAFRLGDKMLLKFEREEPGGRRREGGRTRCGRGIAENRGEGFRQGEGKQQKGDPRRPARKRKLRKKRRRSRPGASAFSCGWHFPTTRSFPISGGSTASQPKSLSSPHRARRCARGNPNSKRRRSSLRLWIDSSLGGDPGRQFGILN